jgi:ketosteroid isomerase-like protein
MSRAERELLRAGYEALSRGDWDTAYSAGSFSPEFELKTSDRVMGAGTYRGPEEARRFFADLVEPFEEVTVEPTEFFERGDQIVVYVHMRLRPAGSSATVEYLVGHLWTFRENKATRLEMFPRREDALEAAGLRE